MISLTSEQITARRVELHTVEDQLRTLGRRRSTLRAEILSGYAQPERTDARQLSLPVEDKAALDEAASEAVAEVMAKQGKATPKKAARPAKKASEAAHMAAYEAEGRALDEEPASIDAQCAAHGADPSSFWAVVLRALENATKRRSVRALVTATGLEEFAVECAIEGLLRDGIVVRARRGGYLLKSKAESRPEKSKAQPKKAAKPAKKATRTETTKGPAAEAAPVEEPPPQPSPEARQAAIRAAILEELGHGLATFGELLTSTMRAFVGTRQGMPRHSEMHEALELLCRIGSVEKDKDGWYRLPPAPEPKKKAPKKPKAPPPTVTVGEAVDKILAAHPPQRWQKTRALVAQRIAGNRGYPIPVAGLYLSGDGQGAEIDAVLALLIEAGAVQRKQSGTQRLVEAGAAVKEDDIPGDILRLTREYLLGLVVDRNEPPTTDELAADIGLPRGLVLSVLDELKDAGRLARAQAGRWIASAQDRTLPILPDVEPAPAREEAAE